MQSQARILPLMIVLTGCEAGAAASLAPLGGRDLGSQDARFRDAGGRDLGESKDAFEADQGPVDQGTEDGGAMRMCQPSASFSMYPVGIDDAGYEGIMMFAPTASIRLSDRLGQRHVVFNSPLPDEVFRRLTFWARVEVEQPFWTEMRLTLWTVDERGRRGEVFFVAWSGSAYAQGAVGNISYRHESEACLVSASDCGREEALRLVATVDGEMTRVSHGERLPDFAYELFNASGRSFVDGPHCPDTPNRWHEGWIYVATVDPCPGMQRDRCIADARCVLWGSEELDPRYVCRQAQGGCEPIVDADLCRNSTSCTWDPGDCYCPAGADCVCAGGPAPKCRSLCGTTAGLTCPGERYCEDRARALPMCLLPPDGGGRCEWRPDDCAGVADVAVCACTPNGPVHYDNDCLRRRDQAGRGLGSMCP